MTTESKSENASWAKPDKSWRGLPTGPLRYFYQEDGEKKTRLVAVIAVHKNDDGKFDVGVARCRSKPQWGEGLDVPNRVFGRNLAKERLDRLLKFKAFPAELSDEQKKLAKQHLREQRKKLILSGLSKEDLELLCSTNPFVGVYCPEDARQEPESAQLDLLNERAESWK